MVRLLPPFRLRQLARRLCDQYPDPPRPVSLTDILRVYAPMLAYTGVIFAVVVIALSLIRGGRGGFTYDVLLLAIIVVGFGFLGGGVVYAVRGGLQRGVYVTGEVVSPTRMRVTLKGLSIEVVLRSRASYQAGNRIDVMVDPTSKLILLVLGPATT